MSETAKGYIAGVLAAAFYGLNPLFALPLYKSGLDADSVLFFRYAFGVLMMTVLMSVERKSLRLPAKMLVQAFFLGIVFSLSSLMLYVSYNWMDAGLASTILFAYPLLVAVIMALVFKERIGLLTYLSIFVAFAGIALLGTGSGDGSLNIRGVAYVLLSSLSYAIYIVAVNRTAIGSIEPERLTFYVLLFGLLVYIVRLDGLSSLVLPETALGWACAVSSALFPTILSLFLMTIAIRRIGPTNASILGALEPVTALLVGMTVFGEQMTFRIFIGIVMVLAAVLAVVAKGRRK